MGWRFFFPSCVVGFGSHPDQSGNRAAIRHDGRGFAAETLDRLSCGINAEVVIDRREKIIRRAGVLVHVLAALVARTDDTAGLQPAAKPRDS